MRRLLLSLALLATAAAHAAQVLPAEFDHNRIHLVVHAPDGSVLTSYVDSGGGSTIISQAAVDRLKLPPAGAIQADDGTFPTVEFPAFLQAAGVPASPKDNLAQGKLLVFPGTPVKDFDVFLGAPWLAGRVWLIDYASHEMVLDPDRKPSAQSHSIPLGFRVGPDGKRPFSMPRMAVIVDGKTLDLLFDTGAMATTTEESAPMFHVAPGASVGASFIMRSVFQDWHARHPDWRVLQKGDRIQGHDFPMIEVPRVTVAGFDVGPVWFTLRDDRNFTGMMAPMMDKPIAGAFGGSGLQYFRIVLDYPQAVAWFTPASR